MNNYFDKVYCVNLDRRVDRWTECLNEFQKHRIEVERFSALDGTLLDNLTILLPGQLGCKLSHLSIIEHAKNNNLKSLVILEDDVEFHQNFNVELDECMSHLPETWNMIFMGANHIQHPTRLNDRIYKLNYSYSAHCYAIHNSVYDLLIELLKSSSEPLDVVYATLQSHINAYVFNPHLAWQKPGYSDICEESVDYTHVLKISL